MSKKKAGRPSNVENGKIRLIDGREVSKDTIIKGIRYLKETTMATNESIAKVLGLPSEKSVSYYLKQADKEIYEDIGELTGEELIGGLYSKLSKLTKEAYGLLDKAPKRNHQLYMSAIKLAGDRLGEEIKFLKELKLLKPNTNPFENIMSELEDLTPTELKAKVEESKRRLSSFDITKLDPSKSVSSTSASNQDFDGYESFDEDLETELKKAENMIMKKTEEIDNEKED